MGRHRSKKGNTKPRGSYPKARIGTKIADHPAALLLCHRSESGWLTLRFDGGCHGNGRKDATGTWGFQVRGPRCEITRGSGRTFGELVTVNVSEWQGLINGLIAVESLGHRSIPGLLIEGDSDLVISQLCGQWKARDFLAEHLSTALDILASIAVPWSAGWIPRDRNAVCDELAASAR